MHGTPKPFRVIERSVSFRCLVANIAFPKGAVVLDLQDGVEYPQPNYMTFDLRDCHLYHPIGRYINHSCEPNSSVDVLNRHIIALNHIHSGDEITFNYLTSERVITAPFDCRCGSINCVGRIET